MVLARNQGGSPSVDGEARRAGDEYKRDGCNQAGVPASHRPWGVVLSQPPGQVKLFPLDMSSILNTHLLFLSLHGDRTGGDLNQLSYLPFLSLPSPSPLTGETGLRALQGGSTPSERVS